MRQCTGVLGSGHWRWHTAIFNLATPKIRQLGLGSWIFPPVAGEHCWAQEVALSHPSGTQSEVSHTLILPFFQRIFISSIAALMALLIALEVEMTKGMLMWSGLSPGTGQAEPELGRIYLRNWSLYFCENSERAKILALEKQSSDLSFLMRFYYLSL